MSVVGPARSQGLLVRVIAILTRPKAEWDVIAGEPATERSLMLGYAAILAAVPALAELVRGVRAYCWFGLCWASNPVFVVAGAVVSYLLTLGAVFVSALLIDALAPSFDAQQGRVEALKVVVYASTGAWVAGVFLVIPWIGGVFVLLGVLYTFYLMYEGLPRLTKTPPDKAAGYAVASIIATAIVFLIAMTIAGAVNRAGRVAADLATGGAIGGPGRLSGTVALGDGASVDLGKLQAAGRHLTDEVRAQQSGGPGKVVAVDPERLKSLLPDTVAGAPRTDVSSTSAGAAGFGASEAEATYQNGDARITLKVTDLAAAGGIAAMAGALNVRSDHETPTGYEKVSMVDGRLTTEKYDNQAKSGEYDVIVANRFSVEADGSGVGMDALKAAVAAVGPDRLGAMSRG